MNQIERKEAESVVMGWIGFRMGGSVSRLAPDDLSRGDDDGSHEDAEAWCFDRTDAALSSYVKSVCGISRRSMAVRSACEDLLTSTYWDSVSPIAHGRFAPLLAGVTDVLLVGVRAEMLAHPMQRMGVK